METIEFALVYIAAYGSLAIVIGVAVYMILLAVKEHREKPSRGSRG